MNRSMKIINHTEALKHALITLMIVAVSAGTYANAESPEALSQPQFKIVVEKDVQIPMRDGSYVVADVFRPDADGQFPILMSMGPYQKDLDYLPHGAAPYGHRETENPEWWVPRGYIQIRVDARGTGKSPGTAKLLSHQESLDFYDSIEWAAKQDWSSGKVGLSGVSYYGITQWSVASLQPPSLKAIIPWEGFSNLYRDAVFHGGIFNSGFMGYWLNHVRARQLLEHTRDSNPNGIEDNLLWESMVNNLDTDYWGTVRARPDLPSIKIPVYSVGNWGGWKLHLRGNVEGYSQVSSKFKKLRLHTGGHTEAFYSDEGQQDRLRFFDYWLKGIDTGIVDEPPVKVFVRTGKTLQIDPFKSETPGFWRDENEWPIARTEYKKWYLSEDRANYGKRALNDGTLNNESGDTQHVATVSAGVDTWTRKVQHTPVLTYVTPPFEEDTEITGHVKLKIWVSSDTGDMDVFAKLHHLDEAGEYYQMSQGLLKVSHRKLDEERSTDYRPFHSHDEEQKLAPDEVVAVEVEIWPTSAVFKKGERLAVEIAPHNPAYYDGVYNNGTHKLYSGGDTPSYLQVPVVPARAK